MQHLIYDEDGHRLDLVVSNHPSRERLTVTAPPPLTKGHSDLSGNELAEFGSEPVDLGAPAVYLALVEDELIEVRPADPENNDPGLIVPGEPVILQNATLDPGDSQAFVKYASAALYSSAPVGAGGIVVVEEFKEAE